MSYLTCHKLLKILNQKLAQLLICFGANIHYGGKMKHLILILCSITCLNVVAETEQNDFATLSEQELKEKINAYQKALEIKKNQPEIKKEPITIPVVIEPVVKPVKVKESIEEKNKSPQSETKEVSKGVEYLKSEDGSNVYNFNFYNKGVSKTSQGVRYQQKDSSPKLISTVSKVNNENSKKEPLKKPIIGPVYEAVFLDTSEIVSSEFNEYVLSKILFRIGHKQSGFYVSPLVYLNETESTSTYGTNSEEDFTGFGGRLGRVIDLSEVLSMDIGFEFNRLEFKYTSEDFNSIIGYDKSVYTTKVNLFSLHLAPLLRWKNINLSLPLSIGTGNSKHSSEWSGQSESDIGSDNFSYSAGLGLAVMF